MKLMTDDQLFQRWKETPRDRKVWMEIRKRRSARTETKCTSCGGTNAWTGPITSCECIDWND